METAAGLAKLVLLSGATAVAGLGLATRLRLDSRAEKLLAACVLAAGIANLTALALGIAGWLRFWPLLAAQMPFVVAAVFLARWGEARGLLEARSALRLVHHRSLRLALALLAVAYGYALFLGFVSEPFAGDALMYHLPLVAEYAREGGIGIPELGRYWGNKYWAYYPGGAYLLYLWAVLPLGTGALANLVQYPFAFAAALASYALARAFGAVRGDAVWAAILFLAVPIVIGQVNTPLVDVTLTFFFAAGLLFLLARPLTPAHLLLGAIAWGAAPAVKFPAAFFIVFGAACVAANQLERGAGWRRTLVAILRPAAALAAGFLVFSGYWFARNWWLTGSPLYPLNLDPGPPPAWSNILVYGLLFPLLDFSPITPDTFNYETGAGPQFMCLAVPALVALCTSSVRQRRLGIALAALLPILVYFVWLYRLSTSVATLLRYVVPAMPIGFAAFAWLLPRVSRRQWLAGLALFSVTLSVALAVPRIGTYTDPESLRLGLAKWRRGEADQRFDVMGGLDTQDYRRTWAYIESLPEPHQIAMTHMIFTYPMLGRDFRHRLHFIETMDRDQWLVEIERRQADLLVMAELIDPRSTVDLGEAVRLGLDFTPAGDEYTHAARRIEPRPIRAIRLRYSSDGGENARFYVSGNGFRHSRELPLPPVGEERTETLAWEGKLESVELLLEFVPRTRMRAMIDVSITSLAAQEVDGSWTELVAGSEYWEMLRWPVEYYWAEELRHRFHLTMRDNDFQGNDYSGEVRVYRVDPPSRRDGAAQ